jgi:hypothetical protein
MPKRPIAAVPRSDRPHRQLNRLREERCHPPWQRWLSRGLPARASCSGTSSHLNCVEDLDGLDIRFFAPAAGMAFGKRTACRPFGVAAGRDALRPELARRVRGEMDHGAMRVDVARAAALVHFAVSIGGLELDAHDHSVME